MKDRRSAVVMGITVMMLAIVSDLKRRHLFFDEFSGFLIMDIILALYLGFEARQMTSFNMKLQQSEFTLVLKLLILYVAAGVAISSGSAEGSKGIILWIVKALVVVTAITYGLMTLRQIKIVRKLEGNESE
ncbi:hypothetical protein HGH92_22465 [Chitinophaga varians]|uniref:Uncharacterized protein n=1 Tax=Chitinophaga varians TaxID=2202339 RepID=A0A847RJ77_9BACT|nr:hypothetical protein [Chitinophaga varians]NLR67089.1 hypothetical protein [Chitinophaga varians]